MDEKRILFIIKERKVCGIKSASYGLVNSAQFVANALIKRGIDAKVVQVVDNNFIDKEVHNYKPTHCFIEALWVTPSKFVELAPLHPNVKWIIRIHSMVPFLVSEGMSFDWINEYQKLRTERGINLYVSCNNDKMYKDLSSVYKDILYYPNIYDPNYDVVGEKIEVNKSEGVLNVGAFGALRVLKNHCQQAFWSIDFANKINKTLHFHINVSEHEVEETSPVLKNLRCIFKNSNHKLIEHPWMAHENFIQLVKQMDFGVQLSFSETFCIVAFDFVGMKVPVIVSQDINNIDPKLTVNLSCPDDVYKAMSLCMNKNIKNKLIRKNTELLKKYNLFACGYWLHTLSSF